MDTWLSIDNALLSPLLLLQYYRLWTTTITVSLMLERYVQTNLFLLPDWDSHAIPSLMCHAAVACTKQLTIISHRLQVKTQ